MEVSLREKMEESGGGRAQLAGLSAVKRGEWGLERELGLGRGVLVVLLFPLAMEACLELGGARKSTGKSGG